jgi:hypothetical protein
MTCRDPVGSDGFDSAMADRVAIRTLVDAYADCADRREAEEQMALFTEDTRFVVCMDSRSAQPTQEIYGREGLRPVFDELNQYEVTTHFNGQSTIELQGDSATGITYCLAHHVKQTDGTKRLMIASIRYLDTFVKRDDVWLFAERRLMVDWIETRPLTS